MEKLAFSFHMQLTFSEPVRSHAFALRCLPADGPGQRVLSASLRVTPACALTASADIFGLKHTGTILLPHTEFTVQAEGTAAVFTGDSEPPVPFWQSAPWRVPSPLTMPGPALRALARELPEDLPADSVPWVIMDLLAEQFTYLPGSTNSATAAEEAAGSMRGVCQDEAQIMLALLRLRRIPCRYCMGCMLGEGATHAWVEVLCGEKWCALDPTNHCPVSENYIRIAVGRDAGDCPVNRGVFSGAGAQRSRSSVSVWRV